MKALTYKKNLVLNFPVHVNKKFIFKVIMLYNLFRLKGSKGTEKKISVLGIASRFHKKFKQCSAYE